MTPIRKKLIEWGMNFNPFIYQLNDKLFQKVFTQRGKELDYLKLIVNDGLNVLVDGPSKIGKTSLLRYLIIDISTNNDVPMKTRLFNIPFRWFDDESDFIKNILMTLAYNLKDEFYLASNILNIVSKTILEDNKNINITIQEKAGVHKEKIDKDYIIHLEKLVSEVLKKRNRIVILLDNFERIETELQRKILFSLHELLINPKISFLISTNLNNSNHYQIEESVFSEIDEILQIDKMPESFSEIMLNNYLKICVISRQNSIFCKDAIKYLIHISCGIPGYLVCNARKLLYLGYIMDFDDFSENNFIKTIDILSKKPPFRKTGPKYFNLY